MSFLIDCPQCGPRSVHEFRFGGEFREAPPKAALSQWAHYVYDRCNISGTQKEWWYHELGCHCWFLAVRNTQENEIKDMEERRPGREKNT